MNDDPLQFADALMHKVADSQPLNDWALKNSYTRRKGLTDQAYQAEWNISDEDVDRVGSVAKGMGLAPNRMKGPSYEWTGKNGRLILQPRYDERGDEIGQHMFFIDK